MADPIEEEVPAEGAAEGAAEAAVPDLAADVLNLGLGDDSALEDLSGLDFGNALEAPLAATEEPPEEVPATLDEPPAEGKPLDGTPAASDEPMIPKSRFDAERTRLKERIALLEGQQAPVPATAEGEEPPAFDFASKRREYVEAVQDGDADKAVTLDEEIRQASLVQAETVAEARAREATIAVRQEAELDLAVQELSDQYPFLDGANEAYNQDATQDILDLHASMTARGQAPAAALRRATRLVLKDYGLFADADAPDAPDAPAIVDTAAPTPTPTPAQIKRKLAQAGNQPPNPGTSRESVPLLDVATMTDDDFDRLTDAQLRAARGDLV